jgi:hypothetical protein
MTGVINMETTFAQKEDNKSTMGEIGTNNVKEKIREWVHAQIKIPIDENLQKASRELQEELIKATTQILEEQRKATTQILEEHKATVRQVVDEEKKTVWKKAELLKQSMLKFGL